MGIFRRAVASGEVDIFSRAALCDNASDIETGRRVAVTGNKKPRPEPGLIFIYVLYQGLVAGAVA